MPTLKDVLDRAEPMPVEAGDWASVVRAARPRRRPFLPITGIATAAAVLFALVLVEPWAGDRRTFLERALAAVDDGPVIHAVLRLPESGTNVHLESGKRTPVYGETEIWYDPTRRIVRQVSRLGSVVLDDHVHAQEQVSRELIALARDYKTALESGTARIAGEDVLDGERVTWVVVVAETVPHAGGPLQEWTQQVAVSRETFKPVATRDAIGGKPAPGTLQRVLELEALPAGGVDLEVPRSRVQENVIQKGHEPIPVERAGEVLGRRPLWLGEEHAELPLRRATETWLRRGRHEETLVEGGAAQDAKACVIGPRGPARIEEPTEACKRHRSRFPAARGGLRIQGDSVYVSGPAVMGEKRFGVSITYGDETDVFGPLSPSTKPYVHLSQATDRTALFPGGAYFPPRGYVSLSWQGRSGSLVMDGIYVVIHASSPELVLSAARALRPLD